MNRIKVNKLNDSKAQINALCLPWSWLVLLGCPNQKSIESDSKAKSTWAAPDVRVDSRSFGDNDWGT
jgi:hypothetical protein